MSDLIRREDVLRIIRNGWSNHCSCKDMCDEIREQPTVSETEIIRKPFERVVDMLESIEIGGDCRHKCNHYDWTVGACNGECTDYVKSRAIKIIKEECGISE